MAHLAHGEVRAASLQPRRPTSYLGRFSWALVPASAAIATAVAAGTLIVAAAGLARPDWTAAFWWGVSLAVAATVRLIQRAVLRRPQPLAPDDVLAADDAIRSRSLHVLAGGGAALVLLSVLTQLGSVHPVGEPGPLWAVRTFGVWVVAALGWNVATSVWGPPRPLAAVGTLAETRPA